MNSAKPIWTPSPQRLAEAGITRYLGWLERERGLSFADYESLWQWSVTAIEDFWESIWQSAASSRTSRTSGCSASA